MTFLDILRAGYFSAHNKFTQIPELALQRFHLPWFPTFGSFHS